MLEEIVEKAKVQMQKAIDALEDNFAGVRTGRANAFVLDKIKVDYYGQPTPINHMAAIKTPDAHMLVIEPWDKSALKSIEQAILASDLGVTPNSDGSVLRLPFPQLSEEHRRDLVKRCSMFTEESRIMVRNARHEANSAVDKMIKEEHLSEDEKKRTESEIQKLTDNFVAKIDECFKKKEAEVMEV